VIKICQSCATEARWLPPTLLLGKFMKIHCVPRRNITWVIFTMHTHTHTHTHTHLYKMLGGGLRPPPPPGGGGGDGFPPFPLPPPPSPSLPPPPPKKRGGRGKGGGGRGEGGGGKGGGEREGNLPDKTKVKCVRTGTRLPGQIACVQRDFLHRCEKSL
jgi:hypothetical protein